MDDYWRLMRKAKGWHSPQGGVAAFEGSLWQYHLQQMVIAPDPIKYLGENI